MMENGGGDRPRQEAAGSAELAIAERDAARAGDAFSSSLRDASHAGVETIKRVASALRPVLSGAGFVAVAILAVRLLRGPGRSSGRQREPAAAKRPLWAVLARSAAVALASAAGRHVAERWIGRRRGDAGRNTLVARLPRP